MLKPYCFALVFVLAVCTAAHSQRSDLKELPLSDLSSFREQAGNWRIVGNVLMNPTIDIHPETPAPVAESAKKKKRSKTEAAPVAQPKAVSFSSGTGVLLNINDDAKKDQLISNLEHGDIELEFEVMLPKGSNSGIYLQGRYEVQLFDSWGTKNAKYSDMGGIYRNWEQQPDRFYAGKAPLANASKAPGLWQKMQISFRAPRFEDGKKISNARFERVVLNGVVIHENVEVPLPTGGPIQNNEVPMGPLMIQGDHGPVAFRNIRYKLMKELKYQMSPVRYDVYHGNFKSANDISSLKPALTGTSPELSAEVTDIENAYAVRYRGEITVPEDARYHFSAVYTGGAKFTLNNRDVFNYPTPDGWRSDTASVVLKAGTYSYEIINFKDASWMPPRLALYLRTANSYAESLHALNSYPPSDNPTSSIYITPGSSPRLVRAFLDFKRDRSRRLTHTIAVGDPSGLHYVYDLKSGNLVCVWRGAFVDATPMWHDRGDGSFQPMGAPLYLFTNQALAGLKSSNDAFPQEAGTGFKGKGYAIDEQTGRPVFMLELGDAKFEDRIYPDEESRTILHEITLKEGNPGEGLYYKLAEGSVIEQVEDGSFAINDKEYYVRPGSGVTPVIRDVNGKKELVVSFTRPSLQYSIIW